jgi:hypothetical protein
VSNQQENEQHHFGQTWPQMFHNRIVDLNELLLLHMFWKREELRRARLDEWNVTYEVRMLLTVNSVATTATIKHDNTNNTPDSFIFLYRTTTIFTKRTRKKQTFASTNMSTNTTTSQCMRIVSTWPKKKI